MHRILEGQVALITGASRGIGRATAELFSAQGALLLLTGRQEAPLRELAESLGNAHYVATDLREKEGVRQIVTACKERYGRLDLLINNAGVLLPGLLGMTSKEAVSDMFAVNILGMMSLTEMAVRLMAKSSAASIVNLASLAGNQGVEGMSAYCASKAAVVGYTLSLSKELGTKRIRVNAVAPGFIDSEMTAGFKPEVRARTLENVRLGRLGTPQDVANAIFFLSSPLASYITGQVLGVDGGVVL